MWLSHLKVDLVKKLSCFQMLIIIGIQGSFQVFIGIRGSFQVLSLDFWKPRARGDFCIGNKHSNVDSTRFWNYILVLISEFWNIKIYWKFLNQLICLSMLNYVDAIIHVMNYFQQMSSFLPHNSYKATNYKIITSNLIRDWVTSHDRYKGSPKKESSLVATITTTKLS